MEYGLIKDTTLTSIADGLRDKGIINLTRDEFVDYISYMSPNATSLDDPTPVSDGSYSIEVNIPEATSLEFVFHIGYYSANKLAAGNLEVASGSYKPYSKRIESSTDRTLTTKIDPYYGNSVTVKLSSYGNAQTMCAITFEVYPLDVDGNRMQVLRPSDITNTVTPEEMAEAITNFDMPINPPEEAFNITGNCDYKFSNNGWNWFIENYGNKINTAGITNLLNFCNNSNKLTEIPFTVNVSNCTNLQQCFSGCHKLIESPKVRGTLTGEVNLMDMIHNCQLIRDFEDLFEADMLESFSTYKVTSAYTCPKPVTFYYCYSLRKIPSWWYLLRLNPESTAFPTNSYSLYRNCVNSCHALDEITNIPVWYSGGAQTSDMFSGFAGNAFRLKEVTFETNNGQPIVTKWKNQTIRLDDIGDTNGTYSERYILNYNSGITKDKLVTDDASYQALKNDPDWYTTDILYSRYNHDSAVRTINSLPDTSEYLATAGGTNTIMFARNSGYHTDGGHPGLLTAEEIAVATAKGWTVSLV